MAAVVLLGMTGCDLTSEPPSRTSHSNSPIGGPDAGSCGAAPAEGCSCQPEVQPADCYLDPIYQDGQYICRYGNQYCRQGSWSGCENIRTYTLPASTALLSDGLCNPCNPNCTSSQFNPRPGDLTPQNSSNIQYDPSTGGFDLTTTTTGGTALVDTDMDGVPDVADQCVGAGWRAPCGATGQGWYHTLEYGGGSAIDPVDLTLRVKTADVYVLMDASGSMTDEIDNLQASLTTGTYDSSCTAGVNGGVLGAIRCTIPDAYFGVGFTREQPYSYSSGDDEVPFHHLLDITNDFTVAQRAVNALFTNGNYDWPEAQAQALYSIASGRGVGRFTPNRTGCASAGAFGYPCFRQGTIPIVIYFTDAPFHEGAAGNGYGYTDTTSTIPMMRYGSAGHALSNDNVATLYDLGDLTSANSLSVMGSTTSLTADFTNPTSCSYQRWSRGSPGSMSTTNSIGGKDAVFRFTLTSAKTLTIDTTGSDYDTAISVWLKGSGTTVTQTACNDDRIASSVPRDAGGGYVYTYTSYISQSFAAGTYYIVVEGSGTDEGSYRLNVNTGTTAAGSTTTAFPVPWSTTTSALASNNVRTIGVLSCACSSTAIALGQCRQQTTARLAACTSAQTTCNGNCTTQLNTCNSSCDATQTSCSNTCTTNQTNCTNTCGTTQTSCLSTCSSNLPACNSGCESTYTSCNNSCAPTRDSCLSGCSTNLTSCTNTCTTAYNSCLSSKPSSCTGTCATTWNTQCAAANTTSTCQSARPSTCKGSTSTSCKTLWNNMCTASRGNCQPACNSTKTTCDSTCQTNYTNCPTTCSNNRTTCLGGCSSTKSSCDTTCNNNRTTCNNSCNTTATSCNTTCSNNRTSCRNTCTSTNSGCTTTCTNNYNACANVANCTTEQSSYTTCYNGLASGSDQDSANDCYNTWRDAQALGNATSSVDGSGSPYVYNIASNGSGLGTAVVSAVQNLANYSRFDVSAACIDNPATAFNECLLVQSIGPAATGCGPRCSGQTGSTCLQCLPGTIIGYRVTFQNNVVMPTSVPQVFDFTIQSYAGTSIMDNIPVRIVVPSGSASQVSPTGSYTQVYDSTMRCLVPPQRPQWGNFTWNVSTPSDSNVKFEFRVSDTTTFPASANSSITISAASTPASPLNLDTALRAAMASVPNGIYLQVKTILNANTALTATPVVYGWNLQYSCFDAE